MVHDTYNGRPNKVYRTAPFLMTYNDPKPRFYGHVINAKYLRNGTRYRYSYSDILIGT